MEKQDFKAKEGDIIRVHYQRRDDLYDRVGFIQFALDEEISLLSCKESIKSFEEKSFIGKLKGLYNYLIKDSLKEPDNSRFIDIPYSSILEVKVFEEKSKMEKKFKEVTPKESVLVRGINTAIQSVAGNLENIVENLPLNDTKSIPEYHKVMEAIKNYRKVIIEKIRYEESNI
ncbi:hypothetical protein KAT80_03840 [Candidatus Pacearchaeota archaeon]|nr:hypothetical protein [Candidatus Pacearchaeota archaeon]